MADAEFVHDVDAPMDDGERDHWREQTRPAAEAGNAMAVLLQRMFATYTQIERLFIDYSLIVEQGAMIALDTQEEGFVSGARWAAETENGVAWASSDNAAEAARAWWRTLQVDGGKERGEPPMLLGDEAARRARATLALAVHARAAAALVILVDRHRLRPEDEGAAVKEAFHPKGGAYEREVAERAIAAFLDELNHRELMFADDEELRGFDDPRVAGAAEAAAVTVESEAADALASAWRSSGGGD